MIRQLQWDRIRLFLVSLSKYLSYKLLFCPNKLFDLGWCLIPIYQIFLDNRFNGSDRMNLRFHWSSRMILLIARRWISTFRWLRKIRSRWNWRSRWYRSRRILSVISCQLATCLFGWSGWTIYVNHHHYPQYLIPVNLGQVFEVEDD